MEIESQLEDVRKRIKDLETCLQHEEFIDEEDDKTAEGSSKSVVFGTHAIPVGHRNADDPTVGKPRVPERGPLLEFDDKECSIVRPAMKTLYRQFLGAGSGQISVEEFRETLKALENLELEQKWNTAERCSRKRIQTYKQKDKEKSSTEDLDMIKSFMESGWRILTAEEQNVDNYSKRKSTADDESQQIKAFRHRLEDSRRREAKKEEILQSSKSSQLKQFETPKSNVTDLETLKKEVKLAVHHDGEAWQSRHTQEVEALVDERTRKFMSQHFKNFIAGTEKALSDMKSELSFVRNEVSTADKARGSLQREHDTLRYETRRIRMELQSACESLKKDNDVRMEDCYHQISMLAENGADIKEQIAELRNLDYRNKSKMVETDGFASKAELQAFKNEQEALCGRILIEGEKEKAIIMDRVEHLSQLYLGGLEDVKAEVSNLKVSLDSSSSARSESLLAEMKRRSKKCLQMEHSMREKVETTTKLCDRYTMELEKSKGVWNLSIENAQNGGGESIVPGHPGRDENSQSISTFQATRLEETAIVNRLQHLEERVTDLAGTILSASNDPHIFANIEKHQEVIQSELHRLDDQMRSTLERLDHIDTNIDDEKYTSLRSELENLGQKVRDATKSRTVILDKMTEMGKKIRKMESAQIDFLRSIEEARASTSDLKERLANAESQIKVVGCEDRDLPTCTAETTTTACVELLHTRVETLEGRVEHVASATITNLRILDSKVDHYRVGVQSALDGAALAESKCGVLGAELVKVFRMLAARNGKLNDHVTGVRSPVLSPDSSKKAHGNCTRCMKSEGVPEQGEDHENCFSTNGCSEDIDDHRRQIRPILNGKAQHGNTSFIENYAESFYQSGQNFKKKIASSKKLSMPAAERFNKTKDSKTGCKSCQRTNIRFEAGRIHVNVCHRVAGANKNRPDNVMFQPQN